MTTKEPRAAERLLEARGIALHSALREVGWPSSERKIVPWSALSADEQRSLSAAGEAVYRQGVEEASDGQDIYSRFLRAQARHSRAEADKLRASLQEGATGERELARRVELLEQGNAALHAELDLGRPRGLLRLAGRVLSVLERRIRAGAVPPAMDGRGPWIKTFTGRRFYPLSPRPEDVFIEDITHALARICRFGGHVDDFYSVAEHSVWVSRACDPADALAGLLHDAAEAYVGDMVRPIKKQMPIFQEVERAVFTAIATRFRISAEMPASVARADEVLLATEARDLMAGSEGWGLTAAPLEDTITPMYTWEAEFAFRRRFDELTRRAA